MNKALRGSCVILILQSSLFGQGIEPVPAPSDVTLHFTTEADQHQYHLGELISVRYSYRSDTPGKYFLVGPSNKLAGGGPVEVSCSPSVERVSVLPVPFRGLTFEAMLNSCGGVGGGVGGACVDCDSETPLGRTEVGFDNLPLNTYVRFRAPGTYTCTASAAEVTMVSRDKKFVRRCC